MFFKERSREDDLSMLNQHDLRLVEWDDSPGYELQMRVFGEWKSIPVVKMSRTLLGVKGAHHAT